MTQIYPKPDGTVYLAVSFYSDVVMLCMESKHGVLYPLTNVSNTAPFSSISASFCPTIARSSILILPANLAVLHRRAGHLLLKVIVLH